MGTHMKDAPASSELFFKNWCGPYVQDFWVRMKPSSMNEISSEPHNKAFSLWGHLKIEIVNFKRDYEHFMRKQGCWRGVLWEGCCSLFTLEPRKTRKYLGGHFGPKKNIFRPPPPNSLRTPLRPLANPPSWETRPSSWDFNKNQTPPSLSPRTPSSPPASRKRIKNIRNVHQDTINSSISGNPENHGNHEMRIFENNPPDQSDWASAGCPAPKLTLWVSQKGGFQKGSIGVSSWTPKTPNEGTKTERQGHKPERGYKTRNDGTKNRNEGTFALSCTRLRVPPVPLHVSRYTCRSWFPGFYSVLQV